MKKLLPVIILSLIVIACCVSAGCTSPNDPILGTWSASEERDGQTVTVTMNFFSDGTGTAVSTSSAGEPVIEKFDWLHTGTVYTFFYGDGTTASLTVMDNEHLKSPSGLVFTRVLN